MTRPSKEEILAEIKRLAADNGGVPVGKRRFQELTSIRESDWYGRHWRRWNDAVIEAGFEPNSMQERVLDDAGLAGLLGGLVSRLGRWPARADLLLERQQDSAFPNPKVFELRLGNRAAQIRAVHALAASDPQLGHLVEVLEEELPTLADDVESPGTVESTGHVYLIRSGKHYKIGRSADLGRRTYEIALQMPERLQLVHAFETDDPDGIERYWHQRFADRRLNGEWFALTAADVAAFKRRRRFM